LGSEAEVVADQLGSLSDGFEVFRIVVDVLAILSRGKTGLAENVVFDSFRGVIFKV
jgi:hypothetical protein